MTFFYLIHFLIMMSSSLLVYGTPCPEASYPIAFGGSLNHTRIYALDYMNAPKLLLGGATWDKDLRKYQDYFEESPLVALYSQGTALEFQFDWAYTLKGAKQYSVRDVAFSKDGLLICAYATRQGQNSYILAMKTDGSLKTLREIDSSSVNNDRYGQKSLSFGIFTSYSTPLIIAAMNKTGSSHSGYMVYKLSVQEDNKSPPTWIKIGYSTRAGGWGFRSTGTNAADVPLAITIGRISTEIFVLAAQSGKLLLSKMLLSTGAVTWTFQITSHSGYDTCQMMNQQSYVPNLQILFFGCGALTTQKTFGRLILDGSTTNIIPPATGGDVYQDTAIIGHSFYLISVYLSQTSANSAKALYYETTERIVYLVELDLAGVGKAIYRKYLPPYPSQGNAQQSTMGIFISETVFYVGSYGPKVWVNTISAQQLITSSTKDFGLIYSSVESKSCYALDSSIPITQASLQLVSLGGMTSYAGVLYQTTQISISSNSLPSFKEIDPTKLYKKSWCKISPYSVTPSVYTSTLNYDATVGKTFTLSPRFSYTRICDTTVVPTWTYSYQMADALTANPGWLSATGSGVNGGDLVLTNACPTGTINIRLLGIMSPTMQFYDYYFTLIGTLIPPLFFQSPLSDQTVAINSVMTPYVHPLVYKMIAGTPVQCLTCTYTFVATGPSSTGFITYSGGTFGAAPVCYGPLAGHNVGTYQVVVTAQEPITLVTSSSQFNIIVANTAPYFDGGGPADIVQGAGGMPNTHALPVVKDAEMQTVTLTLVNPPGILGILAQPLQSATPSVTLTAPVLLVTSTVKSEGIYPLTLKLTDVSGAFMTYTLNLVVVNNPPVFDNGAGPGLYTIHLNDQVNEYLPSKSDPEGNPIKVWLEGDQYSLSFLGITPDYLNITLNPVAFSLVGEHLVSIVMSDGAKKSKYSLRISVLNTLPQFLKEKPKDQKVHVNEVGYYILPKIVDNEKHSYRVVVKSQPDFVILEGENYLFSPNDPKQIGVHLITGYITDDVTVGAWTEFSFKLTVLNDPPIFKGKIQDQRIRFGSMQQYFLPQVYDREKLDTTITAKWREQELPSFMNFTGVSFIFNPLSDQDTGLFQIDMSVTDGYSTPKFYTFIVTVEKKPPRPQPKYKPDKAIVRVVKISRDGTLDMKITVMHNLANITNTIDNRSFSCVIMKEKEVRVEYEIMARNNETGEIRLRMLYPDIKSISSGRVSKSRVSSVQEQDILKITTKEQIIVEGAFTSTIIQAGIIIENPIPPQVSETLGSIAGAIASSMTVVSVALLPGTILMNLFLAMFIQFLWGLLNDLSFLTILTLISISTPGIAQTIQSAILSFIYLDILMTDKWFLKYFYELGGVSQPSSGNSSRILQVGEIEVVDQDSALNSYFDQNGFSSKSLAKNLGSTFIYIGFYIIGYICLIFIQCLNQCTTRLKKVEDWLKDSLMWNSTLRFILQQFPPMLISAIINLYDLKFDNIPNRICSICAIAIIIGMHFALACTFYITWKYQKRVNKKVVQSKFGTLYETLNIKTRIGVYWNSIVLVRWSITIIILIMMRDNSEYQILTLFAVSVIFQILLIKGRPIDDLLEHRISIFNELMVTLYLYLLLPLTDYTPIPSRDTIGFLLIGTITVSALVNFAKFFYLVGCELRLLWRRRQHRLKVEEVRKVREEKKRSDMESQKEESKMRKNGKKMKKGPQVSYVKENLQKKFEESSLKPQKKVDDFFKMYQWNLQDQRRRQNNPLTSELPQELEFMSETHNRLRSNGDQFQHTYSDYRSQTSNNEAYQGSSPNATRSLQTQVSAPSNLLLQVFNTAFVSKIGQSLSRTRTPNDNLDHRFKSNVASRKYRDGLSFK